MNSAKSQRCGKWDTGILPRPSATAEEVSHLFRPSALYGKADSPGSTLPWLFLTRADVAALAPSVAASGAARAVAARLGGCATQRAGQEIGGNVGVFVFRLVEDVGRTTSLTEQWVLGQCSDILLFQSAL